MDQFRADTILAARRHVEDLAAEHGNEFTQGLSLDQVTVSWTQSRPWTNPEVVVREWAYGLNVFDPDVVEDLYNAGIGIRPASKKLEDGQTIAAAYAAEDITLDQARAAAGVDPLAQVRITAGDHAEAEREMFRRREDMIRAARAARDAGVRVESIVEALGVSKPTFYEWMRR